MSFQYSIGLQVYHPYADPHVIERGFALEALHKKKAGEVRRASNGTLLSGAYRESYCFFDLASGDDGKLADCLRTLVKVLEAKQGYINEIKQSGGRLNWFIGWTCGEHGENFDIELLSDLARLGIDFGIQPFADRQRRRS
ncbi:hypothetical protein GRI62_00645 [Erythrobacter arachoides]|uniref:DUF4279 domain-containing protein n=1 Tax=Aurantiacibacter arachoides TaxID=1850444 RepID=A0A844ZVN8_9SPHN|nr:hypothetical protein [Aurantiacibacter arachoides]MXO92113.1 hypothetical protein [Aurantiacibacter arachoides]GGD59621.1 hypothetical protein GCM10011411_19760 [Aurantiacibacter arachoides]